MSNWALNSLRRIAVDLQSFEDGRFLQDAVDSFIMYLELVYRKLLVQEQLDGHSLLCSRVRTIVSSALANLRELQIYHCSSNLTCRPPLLCSGLVGRPRFDVPQEQMIALVVSGFTGPQMADIVGVSLSTIRRKMAQFGLSVSSEYTSLSDTDLDTVIGEIKLQFPTSGCKQMQRHLQSQGYRVQQLRIRESLRKVDPEGSVMRQLRTLNHRQYRVAAPRALWHMDGNHKLIRYVYSTC